MPTCIPFGSRFIAKLQSGLAWLLLGTVLLSATGNAYALTYVSRATGNWNATGTWAIQRAGTITTSTASAIVTGVGTTFTGLTGVLYRTDGVAIGTILSIQSATQLTLTANAASTNSGIVWYHTTTTTPIAGDTATVNTPNTVTVSAAAASANLTINSGGILTQTASTLTLTGTLSVAGTHTVGNTLAVTGATTVSGLLNITTITGTKTFTGGITINPGGEFGNNTVAELITIGGNLINNGTFTSGTALIFPTYTFNSAGQWGGSNPITFLGTGTVTVSAARTSNTTVGVTGNLSVTAGGLTNNGTLNTTGTFAISAANTITNNGTVTAAGAITGGNATTSIWTNAANSTLNAAAAFLATGTLNASASGNTVHYNGAGAQAVKLAAGGNYHHLTVSGGNTKTPPAGTHNIGGNLTINTGTIFNANASDPTINVTGNVTIDGTYTASNNAGRPLTIAGNLMLTGTYTGSSAPVNLAGNFTDSGTFTSSTGAVTFNGTAAQTLDGTSTETSITNVVMDSTAAIAVRKLTLSHDLRVTGTLTLTNGRIASSGSAKTIIPSGASISGASSNSFVSGRLQMNIPNGNNQTVTFPIGTEGATAPALGYSPASFLFSGTGGSGGGLLAYAVLGDHPQIASSTLDAAKSVNRYWVLTGVGVTGTVADLTAATMDSTLTFLNPEDLDSGVNTANFETERYNGVSWFTPGPGARTATSTTALGVNNVGEFAIAEKGAGGAPGGGYNIFETTTTAGSTSGVILTKVAGVNFNLAVVSLTLGGTLDTSYNKTVRVELLDASDNTGAFDAEGCRATWTSVIATLSPDPTFSPSDNGRITVGPFNVANAYRDVRARVTNVTGVARRGCSSDNFAIRPASFTVAVTDGDWSTAGTMRTLANTGATGGNVHKAGRPFTITVTPSPGTATSYDGSPVVSALACTLPAVCANGTLSVGTFTGSGTRTSSTATYSEAGVFNLTLVDQNYASVDAADGTPADCSATGLYICQSPAPVAVGRFVPDRFEFTGPGTPTLLTFNDAVCGTRSFTYVGQPFWYAVGGRPSATVNAVNAAGVVTSNYTLNSASAKPAMGEVYADGTAPVAAPLNTTLVGAPAGLTGSGTGTYMGSATGQLSYTRSTTTPVVPFTSAISLTVTASDGTESAVSGNGTITTPTPLVFSSIAFDSGAEFRYGRLRIGNANGSQLLPLKMQMQAQYWASTNPPTNTQYAFITNSADSCTTIAAANIALGNYQNNLNACETSVTAGSFSGGRSSVLLSAPGLGNYGSVDLTVNLGAGAGLTCAPGAMAATGANRVYLQGNWSGGTYDQNPTARATFGVYRGSDEIIHIRENY